MIYIDILDHLYHFLYFKCRHYQSLGIVISNFLCCVLLFSLVITLLVFDSQCTSIEHVWQSMWYPILFLLLVISLFLSLEQTRSLTLIISLHIISTAVALHIVICILRCCAYRFRIIHLDNQLGIYSYKCSLIYPEMLVF